MTPCYKITFSVSTMECTLLGEKYSTTCVWIPGTDSSKHTSFQGGKGQVVSNSCTRLRVELKHANGMLIRSHCSHYDTNNNTYSIFKNSK